MKKYALALLIVASSTAHADFYGGLSANRFDAEIIEDIKVQGSSWGGEIGYSHNPYIAAELRAAPPWIGISVDANGLDVDIDGYSYSVVVVPSYPITDKVSIGLTGYYLKQLTDDKLNGVSYSGGKEEALYMGPGAQFRFDKKNVMNLNVYFPVEDKNRPSGGVQLNLVYGYFF